MIWTDSATAVRKWLSDNITTVRLGVSYLTIIMVMSISFSVVFYKTSWHELGRQLPPRVIYHYNGIDPYSYYDTFLQHRISEGRNDLLVKLGLINIGALLAGGILSYALARRTLEPIEQAMETQSRFASDASHELRTPLATIKAENEVALRSNDLTLAHAKELLKSNLEEVVKLSGLAEGLLRLAQKDQQSEIVEAVSLPDVVADAINSYIKSAQAKEVNIQDNVTNVMVLAEQQSLTLAVSVLLDNAIKYSNEKSTIYVKGFSKGKFGCVSVRDEGVGISSEALPYIFDRFYRVDSSRNKQNTDGYGLGLSIAYKVVRQFGGDITVESEPSKGSTFTIKMPSAL